MGWQALFFLNFSNGLKIQNCCWCSTETWENENLTWFSIFQNCLNAANVFYSHKLRIPLWNGVLHPSVSLAEIKSMLFFFITDAQIHSQQMPGHSHKLLILLQHVRLSDFDCHLFQTKDFKARHKCLLNFIWLISLKSIFVTSKDSTCYYTRKSKLFQTDMEKKWGMLNKYY